MTAPVMEQLPAGVAAALMSAQLPDMVWVNGDDLCDCTFQRIGIMSNPYIARTVKVRMCCIWEELYRQYPEFVQRIPGYRDPNRSYDGEEPYETYDVVPLEWNGETAMPRALWHRQLQALTGQSLDEIREEHADVEPPAPKVKLWTP